MAFAGVSVGGEAQLRAGLGLAVSCDALAVSLLGGRSALQQGSRGRREVDVLSVYLWSVRPDPHGVQQPALHNLIPLAAHRGACVFV